MHHRPLPLLALAFGVAFPLTAHAGDLPGSLMSFADRHCLECHDDTTTKGGLNLLDLDFDPGNPTNFKTWQRVFERVRDGEMPPEKKPRPETKERETFLTDLGNPLLKTDRADIAEKGRVRSRRLTRVEYEHTIHELLGIDLPLVDLLPEDPETHGFETVAEGQQLSHHQLASYLDVADLALADAFERAREGDVRYRKFFTPEDLLKNRGGNYRGPDLRDGKSVSWPITLQFFGRMRATAVPSDGWYRVTLRDVEAINPGKDGAVWGTLRSGTCDSNAPMLYMVGLVEATPKPRDLVFEAWIRKGHQLELKPNDAELKRAPTGARGGNVSFKGRDLRKEGFAGIAHAGIEMERIYPVADQATVRKRLFGEGDFSKWEADPENGLNRLVARFAERAFRRPVARERLAPYLKIGRQALVEGESLPETLRASYRAILCSPRFLSFVEAPGELDDFAVASRLSYALWVGPPDDRLLKLAAEGKLREPGIVADQVDRMLSDAKAERFIESFTDQWLKLKQIDFTAPDPRQFRTFDPVLQESFLAETRAYVAELVRNDLDVTHLVDSDFAFLNGRLARHYQLDLPLKAGAGLQKVAFPAESDTVRGGLVTQGAILKVTADGTHTSPVVRGVFINERILGAHIPPPPPGVPAIEPDIRGATSIRDQLEKHRDSESCASCHQTIDPPGFALENFDPIGGWRVKYGIGGKGAPVNPTGVTPEGDAFADVKAWKLLYQKRADQLAAGFATQFLTYATGAAPRFSDSELMDAIVAESGESGHGIRSLIRAAFVSPIFLSK